MFGLVWSGSVWFSMVKFGLVWSIHIQTNKLNNYLILINLICEFVCWKSVTDGWTDERTDEQTDLCIELRYAQLIMQHKIIHIFWPNLILKTWKQLYSSPSASLRLNLFSSHFDRTKKGVLTPRTKPIISNSKCETDQQINCSSTGIREVYSTSIHYGENIYIFSIRQDWLRVGAECWWHTVSVLQDNNKSLRVDHWPTVANPIPTSFFNSVHLSHRTTSQDFPVELTFCKLLFYFVVIWI